MAKSIASGPRGPAERPWSHPDRGWEVREAMHTIMRAGDHLKDAALMKEVRKHAGKHAKEKTEEARRASALAKAGHISPKQLAKLNKTASIA